MEPSNTVQADYSSLLRMPTLTAEDGHILKRQMRQVIDEAKQIRITVQDDKKSMKV